MSICQFYPNRLSVTPERTPISADKRRERIWKKFHPKEFAETFPELSRSQENSLANLLKSNHPFTISKSGRKNLLDSINSIYLLSPPRTIKTNKGKFIYNFRCSFITLTLPSIQLHPDLLFKEKCLHQLFVELRKFYQVRNYVWKTEIQGNGNIHFHIVTDQYIDYYAIRHRWNRILNKFQYVDNYAIKWKNITLRDYVLRRCGTMANFAQLTAVRRSKLVNAWREGTRTNWANPNSVDVRTIRNNRDLGAYIAKYISKQIKAANVSTAQFDRETTFGRSWYRSSSLSQLKYKNKIQSDNIADIIAYFRRVPEFVKEFAGDFFRVFYFKLDSLSKGFQKWFIARIILNSQLYGYIRPVPL